jgi:hypothetical protein
MRAMADSPPIVLSYATESPRQPRRRLWAFVLLSIPGLILPTLDFTFGVSPLRAVIEGPQDLYRGFATDTFVIVLLAIGFFIPIALLAWRVRQLFGGPVGAIEKVIAGAVAIAEAIVLATFFVMTLPPKSSEPNELVAIGVIPIMLLAGGCFLLSPAGRRITVASRLTLALLLVYTINCAVCLLGFMGDHNDIGYYITMPAMLAAIIELVFYCVVPA